MNFFLTVNANSLPKTKTQKRNIQKFTSSNKAFNLPKDIQNIFNKYKKVFTISPISPIRSPQSSNTSLKLLTNLNPTPNHPQIISNKLLPKNFVRRCGKNRWIIGKNLSGTINRCAHHILINDLKFCLDCFLINYLGPDFNKDSELRNTAIQFKNSIFQNINFNDLNYFIPGTKIPLFDCCMKTVFPNIVASCKRHIFTPPQYSACSNCFWINWLKH